MKQKEEVNNISKELLDLIPPLKKGETAVYELIGGVDYTIANPDNTTAKAKVFPAIQQLINKSVIYDKGHDDNIKIGYVTSPGTKEKDPKYGTIEFKASNGSRIFVTDAKKDRVLYNFLELHPYNQDNVNPDAVAPPGGYTFKRVKPEATAAEKLEQKRLINRAKATIELFPEAELKELAKAAGINSTLSEAEIINALYDKADDVRIAKTILNREANAAIAINALLDEAQKHKVIEFNADENEWRWVETSRKILGQQSGEPLESLKRYMSETDAGETFQDNLKKAVKEATSKKKK